MREWRVDGALEGFGRLFRAILFAPVAVACALLFPNFLGSPLFGTLFPILFPLLFLLLPVFGAGLRDLLLTSAA